MANKKMAIIATKGTLDMAYPPFILASTAAALGYDVQVFFTFYGLQLLRKDLSNKSVNSIVSINSRMLKEGESLAPGLRLEQITPDGVILSYKGYRFQHGIR